MAVENTPRRAGPFVSNGSSTAYAFSFRVFEPDDVEVIVSSSADENAPDATLAYQTDYTVSINGDQENNPGGTVTLIKAPAQGIRVTLLSQVEATQDVQLTNHGGFSPKILNTVHDKLTILLQQLMEKAERHLTVPATSDKTPEQVLTEILNIAATANTYLGQAKEVLDRAILVDANVAANAQSVSLMKASVDASEQNVAALASQVNEYSDELVMVAENLTDIDAIGTNIGAIQAVSNDLRGLPIYRFDCGPISEPLTPANGIGGVLQICAENIDIIRQVAESLENATELTSLAEVVSEIGSTDYTAINNTGNTGD